MVVLGKDLKGSILDIGGGGEGFIGRAYGEQVVAIDHSQEELDEAPNGFEKVLMDATDLKYESCHFDNVSIGVQGVQTRLKRNVRFESK